MSTELTALPSSFAAGTTVTYRKSFDDYPASEGWTLTLYLAGANVTPPVVAVPDGDDFVVTVGADVTADGFAPGLYKYVERVSKDDEVYEVDSGVVTISPDLTVAGDGDEQEWVEEALAMLRAHVRGRLPSGMQSYSIAGRTVSKLPIEEAFKLITQLETRLARLKNPGRVTHTIFSQFVRPGDET